MSEHSPFDSAPDAELGAALREALAMPFGGAFVNRVRARLNQSRQRSWDEELAGWGLNAFSAAADDTDTTAASIASQLLDGTTPGASVLLASMTSTDTP